MKELNKAELQGVNGGTPLVAVWAVYLGAMAIGATIASQ